MGICNFSVYIAAFSVNGWCTVCSFRNHKFLHVGQMCSKVHIPIMQAYKIALAETIIHKLCEIPSNND